MKDPLMPASHFRRVVPDVAPEHDRPAPDRLVSGDPRFTTWNVATQGRILCGQWEATPGKFRLTYDEWEYCRILSGVSVVSGADGVEHRLGPGDSFILEPGFDGTWEVIETTRKDYVIVLPDPSA
jgi:hypothetical protein